MVMALIRNIIIKSFRLSDKTILELLIELTIVLKV